MVYVLQYVSLNVYAILFIQTVSTYNQAAVVYQYQIYSYEKHKNKL